MVGSAIEIEEVSKHFKKAGFAKKLSGGLRLKKVVGEQVVALNKVSLKVEQGEVFGLLGPNGAGKTTMIKILNTIITPDSGSAKIFGFDVVKESLEVRERIGVLPEDSERGFFWRLSTLTNLLFYAREYMVSDPKKRVQEVCQIVELEKEDMHNWFQKLSKGNKQKVALARALIPNSQVLFMDEPQRSLDILFVSRLKELIRSKFGKKDRTVFLSSHDLHLVEETCDRIAIIEKGRIVTVRQVDELKTIFAGADTVVYILDIVQASKSLELLSRSLRLINGVSKAELISSSKIQIFVEKDCLNVVNEILKTVMEEGYSILSFSRTEASLEEAIMKILREGDG